MISITFIGNVCIGLAVGFSVLGIILFVMARLSESEKVASIGRATVYANFIALTIATLAMVYALLANDFSVSYVAHVGSRSTPRWISAISLWSSLEGSILFWGWVLAAISAICIYQNRERYPRLMAWVGVVLLAVEFFFFLLLALPANPFIPVNPIPMDGPGPNPLLQNHWLMAVHPPTLYIGYIGFTIPFAFAVGTLLERDFSTDWVPLIRRWTLFAWSFLSIAIVLGGWWSYAVLGWGGYWAWDPVENASLMPWLTGTALVHSVMVQEKRKMLSGWNIMLAILTFLLTILGTFLTRSGVLESVHSFTQSPIGPYFLFFICVVLTISLVLLIWQAPQMRRPARFESLFSLEVLFLFNNLLFLSLCFIVILGTLYPLVAEALQGIKVSVGEPYFNQMTVPINGMILLLMGISLITPWKKATLKPFLNRASLPAIISLIVTVVAVILGARGLWLVTSIFLAGFAFFVMLIEWVQVLWRRGGGFFKLFAEQPRRYGGFVAHIGALMIIVAIGLSHVYEKEQELVLKRGSTQDVLGYTLTMHNIVADQRPQRFEVKALIDVSRNDRFLTRLTPQMNYYPRSREPVGSPAIRSTLIEDLYLTLVRVEKDGSGAAIRAIVTPAVAWIWIGGVVLMLGGLIALVFSKKKNAGNGE